MSLNWRCCAKNLGELTDCTDLLIRRKKIPSLILVGMAIIQDPESYNVQIFYSELVHIQDKDYPFDAFVAEVSEGDLILYEYVTIGEL